MAREAFLLVFQEHGKTPVPAHWSMFIPSSERSPIGSVFQAIGNPFIGYQVEHKVCHDISLETTTPLKISLGFIDTKLVPELAAKALEVKASGVSKKPLDLFAVGTDCWLSELRTDGREGGELPGLAGGLD
jgi:hypothetical protein